MSDSMTDNSRERIRAIFAEAYRKRTPEERSQYLDEVCGADAPLRAELESLLEAHDKYGNFLEGSPAVADVTLDDSPISEGPGTVIGRYKLLEKIGEGGMAVVYMAEQEQPVRRKVALKIIKLGMDTKSVIARFEAERQALAMMEHPNIAKVLDAGATETGRPYFVMELVKGVSITDYCDANSLSTKERLELFIQVCNAVQHAHQKGIIHRDIKPTNVMVTLHDGEPIPKVIDFGIAKAINQKLTEKTLFTRYAHIIGTPAYMSPEQAELSDLDIDTRTDIYSLGVLLYELLTGTPPFGEEELRKAGYIEMQRVIREQEPTKPSTKLSTLGETLTDIAKRRSATPDLLRKAIRGDLDWIVMKSLEKDRARRYETANGLALDIQRHIDHNPVVARGPSTTYRLQKFLRRNRSRTIAALAVVAAASIITILSVRTRYQVRLAEAEGIRQVNVLGEARKLIARGDLSAARKALRPLLESQHIGLEARILFANTVVAGQEDETLRGTEAIMERHYRERVQYYTEKIGANPKDPNNYLQRAQQYHYLRQEQDVHADMRRYRITLDQGSPSDLQLDTPPPRRFAAPSEAAGVRRVINGPFNCQVVFSAERPVDVNEIPLLNVAFGQKGRCNMKSFQIPILSMSLLGLCLLSGLDTPSAYADFRFGTPTTIPTGATCTGPSVTADGLMLFADSSRLGGYGNWDIWVLTRQTTDDDWGAPVNVGAPVNSSYAEGDPAISADGLTLYFHSNRLGGQGGVDIYMTTRETIDSPWSEPVNLGPPINSPSNDGSVNLSADGLSLFFERPGGYGNVDILVATRETIDSPWSEPRNLGPVVNGPAYDATPSISADGRTLFFGSDRPGGIIGAISWDLWMTRRATTNDTWTEPVNLGPVANGPYADGKPCISYDGSILYFVRDGTQFGLWQVPIEPVVDLNRDGIVDAADVVIMVEHWLTDHPLCDIGPIPWGDGIVDAQDLTVLAEHLFEDYRSTTIERRISGGVDDAEEALNPGYNNWNYSSDLEIVDDRIDNGGRQLIGLTFRDIYIAPGQVISNAYIEFVCDETRYGTDAAYFLIWGHLTPNSEGFNAPFVISNRPQTAAKVPWEPDPWTAEGQKIQTVNIASIIQELIDQQGWAAGNAVEIIIGADPARPSFTGVRVAESYDGVASSAPLLHIEIAAP